MAAVVMAAGGCRGVEGGRPGWRGKLTPPGGDRPSWTCTCRPIHPDRQAARGCALAELDRRDRRKPAPAARGA